MITIRWNKDELKEATRIIMRNTKYKTFPDFAKWRAKLVTNNLLLFTPPRGKNPSSEGWEKQKKRGIATLKADISKVFGDLGKFKFIEPKVQKSWNKAIRKQDIETIDTLCRSLRIPFKRVMFTVDPGEHTSLRNNRGRVPGRWDPLKQNLVIKASSLKQYIAELVSHVGRAKWGWGRAAVALGAKAPAWVSRHTPGGAIIPQGGNTAGMSKHIIRVINDAQHTSNMSESEIVGACLAIERNSLGVEAEKMLANELKKHSKR